MNDMRVTKTQAAQRQIDVAVRMLFLEEDAIAVHTLASAAFRIVRDLSVHKTGDSLLSRFAEMIRPGKEKEFWKAINRPANFLKHADTDPNEVLEGVSEESNEMTLFMSSLLYVDLGNQATIEMAAIIAYVAGMNPQLVTENHPHRILYENEFGYLREMPKSKRYEHMMSVLRGARQSGILLSSK